MAGAGWRQYTRETLSSTVVQTYLQDQVVMRFASTAARDAALTAPAEGMTAYIDALNLLTVYDGSGWRYAGPSPWVYPSTSTGTYSAAISGATFADLAGYTSFTVPAPAGRLVEVEFSLPRLIANASSNIQLRLMIDGTVYDGAEVSAGAIGGAVGAPVKMMASVAGTGVDVTAKVMSAAAAGTGTASASGGRAPWLRHRYV